ncbi:MAG: EAL domain-containing protein, partial [Trueperaceae bacterium]
LSINLPAPQPERRDFVSDFGEALHDTGAYAANIIAEVTETFAMQHPLEAARVLNGLAELGVTLAIDDFGTGYSNLGQLQHLPFQIVKIDRSFLQDVPENARNFALVRTIVAMGQSLDLAIIAEGVETKTQADFLYWEGATWLQGFYFGRPMPSATFGQVALSGAVPFSEP